MRAGVSRSCWRSRCWTTRRSRTCSEKTTEACGAASSSDEGDGASRAESAACVRVGRVGPFDSALPVQTTGRLGIEATIAGAGGGAAALRVSALRRDAGAPRSRAEPQEALSGVPRRAADGAPASRAKAGTRYASTDDAAYQNQPALVARLRCAMTAKEDEMT